MLYVLGFALHFLAGAICYRPIRRIDNYFHPGCWSPATIGGFVTATANGAMTLFLVVVASGIIVLDRISHWKIWERKL